MTERHRKTQATVVMRIFFPEIFVGPFVGKKGKSCKDPEVLDRNRFFRKIPGLCECFLDEFCIL